MPRYVSSRDEVACCRPLSQTTGRPQTRGLTIAFFDMNVGRCVILMEQAGARGIILSPTRELCQQTEKVVQELGRFTGLRTALLIGGESMDAQFAMLARNPDMYVERHSIGTVLLFRSDRVSVYFLYVGGVGG